MNVRMHTFWIVASSPQAESSLCSLLRSVHYLLRATMSASSWENPSAPAPRTRTQKRNERARQVAAAIERGEHEFGEAHDEVYAGEKRARQDFGLTWKHIVLCFKLHQVI